MLKVKSYWSRAEIYETYEKAQLVKPIHLPCGGRIRFYNGNISLYKPPSRWDNVYNLLWTFPDIRFKSFEFEPVDLDGTFKIKGSSAFYVPDGWEPNKEVSYAMRKSLKENLTISDNLEGVEDLVYRWHLWAKTRAVFISYGHYLHMVKHRGFTTNSWFLNGELVGVTSYLEDENSVTVTVLKHLPKNSWLSRAIWGRLIINLLSKNKRIFCGETATKLKRSMGFLPYPLYRLNVDAVRRNKPIEFKPLLVYDGNLATRKYFEFLRENEGVFK